MSRAIWKGNISFGLVNIPITLFSAEHRPDISLRMIDSRNNARVRYDRVNAATGEEVPWNVIVKGYEYDEGKYVLLSDEEMEKVKVEVTKTVEITDFVDIAEISPLFFDKPYYLTPSNKQARKGYALLREVLRRSGKAGIAKVVIRAREYLCALIDVDDILVLNVLRFAQEIRDVSEFDVPGDDLKELKISDKEIDMATKLVDAMTSDWEPEQYHDDYRHALMNWIEKKVAEGNLDVSPDAEFEEAEAPKATKVVDLMDYLKQSVEQAGSRGKGGGGGKKKRKPAASGGGKKKQSAKKRKAS